MRTICLVFLAFTISVFCQDKNTLTFNAVKDTSIKANEMIIEITVSKNDTLSTVANQSIHNSLLQVLEVIRKYGYKDEDIFLRESNFQNRDYPKVNNFHSQQVYRIVFGKFELFDQLKKELIEAGATGIRIEAFWLSNYKEIKKDLYIKAIKEAKEKAKLFAAQMGLENVHISNIIDNSREESNNAEISFLNNEQTVERNAFTATNITVATQQSTITNGQVSINVFLKITFSFN